MRAPFSLWIVRWGCCPHRFRRAWRSWRRGWGRGALRRGRRAAAASSGVRLGATTLRERTYAAGAAALAVEGEALAQAMRAPARAAQPPAVLQVSIDATKVPLVGGGWTDVKLAVFADPALGQAGTGARRWSRRPPAHGPLEAAAQFGQTLTLEAQRRGLDEAGVVVSPNDGAEWIRATSTSSPPGHPHPDFTRRGAPGRVARRWSWRGSARRAPG
ncbi:MAG: hypothetical protein U0841_01690 [Chloroflexia bacterium]